MNNLKINSIVAPIGFFAILLSLLMPLIWPNTELMALVRLVLGVFMLFIVLLFAALPNDIFSASKHVNWSRSVIEIISLIILGLILIGGWSQLELIKDNDSLIIQNGLPEGLILFAPLLPISLFCTGMLLSSINLAKWLRIIFSVSEKAEEVTQTSVLNWSESHKNYLKDMPIVSKENERLKKEMRYHLKRELNYHSEFLNLLNDVDKVGWDFDKVFSETIDKVFANLEFNHKWPKSARSDLKSFMKITFKDSMVSEYLLNLLDEVFGKEIKSCSGRVIISIIRLLDKYPTEEEYKGDKGEKYLLSKFYSNKYSKTNNQSKFNSKLEAIFLLIYSQHSAKSITDPMNIHVDPMRADLIDETFMELCRKFSWNLGRASDREIFGKGLESYKVRISDSIGTPSDSNIKHIQAFISKLDSRIYLAMEAEDDHLSGQHFQVLKEKMISIFEQVN